MAETRGDAPCCVNMHDIIAQHFRALAMKEHRYKFYKTVKQPVTQKV
jgi:hypothetical protein